MLAYRQKVLLNIRACVNRLTRALTSFKIPYTAHRQQAPLILSLLNVNNINLDLNEMKYLFIMFNRRFLGKNVTPLFGMNNKTQGNSPMYLNI